MTRRGALLAFLGVPLAPLVAPVLSPAVSPAAATLLLDGRVIAEIMPITPPQVVTLRQFTFKEGRQPSW